MRRPVTDLLAEQEPDELGVGHPPLLLRTAARHRAAEDPLDHARAQGWGSGQGWGMAGDMGES